MRPPFTPIGFVCLDTCGGHSFNGVTVTEIDYTDDQHCDDGGEGAAFSTCPYGTDCTDCGERDSTGVYKCLEESPTACTTLLTAHGGHHGVSGSNCFASFYNLENHNQQNFGVRRTGTEVYVCLALPWAPPPPTPPPNFETTLAITTLWASAEDRTSLVESMHAQLQQRIANALQGEQSVTVVYQGYSRRRLDAPDVPVTYECCTDCCSELCSAMVQAKSTHRFLIGVAHSELTNVQSDAIRNAINTFIREFRDSKGTGVNALCGISDNGVALAPIPPSPPPPLSG